MITMITKIMMITKITMITKIMMIRMMETDGDLGAAVKTRESCHHDQ